MPPQSKGTGRSQMLIISSACRIVRQSFISQGQRFHQFVKCRHPLGTVHMMVGMKFAHQIVITMPDLGTWRIGGHSQQLVVRAGLGQGEQLFHLPLKCRRIGCSQALRTPLPPEKVPAEFATCSATPHEPESAARQNFPVYWRSPRSAKSSWGGHIWKSICNLGSSLPGSLVAP